MKHRLFDTTITWLATDRDSRVGEISRKKYLVSCTQCTRVQDVRYVCTVLTYNNYMINIHYCPAQQFMSNYVSGDNPLEMIGVRGKASNIIYNIYIYTAAVLFNGILPGTVVATV